ncbi:MAG: metallophosphoesterase [Aquificaceae bacterium]|nr:metallophosphoesterase [Aquificaceae bacterium]
MRWFIPLFLTVFIFMHIYTFLRFFKPAISKTHLRLLALVPFSLGFFSPFVWRYADAHASPQIAYITALLGLFWLGFLFYSFFIGLFVDLYRGLVFLSKKFLHINPLPTPSHRTALLVVLTISLTLSAYSHYETLNLRVERFTLETDKLPKGVERIRILHTSDMHLGPVMGMDKIRLVMDVYRREKPDMVVSTGDLVDGNMRNKLHLAGALSEMRPPLGKYAVLGNHEYYRGVEQAIDFMQRAGFKLLRGEVVYLEEHNLTIVGMDDRDCRFFQKCTSTLSDTALLQKASKESFVLYLKHRPELEKQAYGLFDLMLSGHTHGGVYYPVGKLVLTKMFLADRGFHKLSHGYLYVSKGVGTGGPPMRLFSPPDVAIIDLLNKRR